MRRWVNRIRRRPRQFISLVLLTVITVGMLVAGGWVKDGYAHELLVNLGAGIGMVIATYVVLDPIIQEIQRPDVREHSRLNFPEFFGHMERATGTVAILETWTGALENRHVRAFRSSLAVALANNVSVQLLLLDPDSAAATQRTEELGGQRDAREQIMENLRQIVDIRRRLEGTHELLEVRLYSASPSVQMYRWDDKAFLSFYPIGRLAYDTKQIETYLASPWGEFVQRRFDDLWGSPSTQGLEDYLAMVMAVRYQGQPIGECSLPYVRHAGHFYVPNADLGEYTTWRDSRLIELQRLDGDVFRLDRVNVDLEADAVLEVTRLFDTKYGRKERSVVRLSPHVPT